MRRYHCGDYETMMARWKGMVRFAVFGIVATVVLSFGAAYLTTALAQEAYRQQTESNSVHIAVIESVQARNAVRLDLMQGKVDNISDRLSTIQGMGAGITGLIIAFGALNIGLQLRSRKPA
jgi:hypothetical protein